MSKNSSRLKARGHATSPFGVLELKEMYKLLNARFGFLNWWPGETKVKIIVGAILTQNTSWRNVEKAIAELKKEKMLSIEKLANSKNAEIERYIRSSGFYRQKAGRLIGIMRYIYSNYGTLEKFFSKPKDALRIELLSLNGIGNETADSIILYAAEKPVFVIDAYTKRIMHRVYGISENIDYEDLRGVIEGKLPRSLVLYKDFHAQFVELGKNYCKKRPLCSGCPLRDQCAYANHSTRKKA